MKILNYNALLHDGICGVEQSSQGLIIGNRVPKDYFITSGTGESEITIHAGSYHLALKEAGIEMANIITYSSILPSIATEIPKPPRTSIIHGEVMECIMAVANGNESELISAGIIFAWLYDKNNKKYGGLVCEHNGNYNNEELEWRLEESLKELYENGFSQDFSLKERRLITQELVPQKKYGTALVALCFTNYFYPILNI